MQATQQIVHYTHVSEDKSIREITFMFMENHIESKQIVRFNLARTSLKTFSTVFTSDDDWRLSGSAGKAVMTQSSISYSEASAFPSIRRYGHTHY